MEPNLGFIVCDDCGCVVVPEFMQVHSDWHDGLEGTARDAVGRVCDEEKLANPLRIMMT